MIPQLNQYVKCILRNNVLVEGIVLSWSDDKSALRSKTDESISIIRNTKDDVLLVKIIIKDVQQVHAELEQKFEETRSSSSDDLRIKEMAELKILLNEQEKKIITEKMRDHTATEIKKSSYGYPMFGFKGSK